MPADDTAPGRAGQSALRFHLDQPCVWRDLPRALLIRGWCFSADGLPVTGVRLRTTDRVLSGVVGLPRPDVKAALPAAPGNNTGFEIRGTLPPGRHTLTLEAEHPDGTRQVFFTQAAGIRQSWWPRWLGGGSAAELIAFQMPAHPAYPARTLRCEKFPPVTAGAPRPKFSIVTPSFNQARFLPETMRSVLEQPDVTCQYVVQDGGSIDGSKELIAHFAETGDWRREAGKDETGRASSELRSPASSLQPPANASCAFAWDSAPDAGQADAIARGFAKTTGGPDDLMAWINSDDYYLPGALAYVADYFARHPHVDVVYGHRIVVDEDSREIARWFLPRHDPEVLGLNDFLPQETLFWRRRLWDQVGGIDASFKFAMDWDLLLRFQAAGAKFVRVPRFLACFRVHAAQKTSAQMHDVGQREIDHLRERAQGRHIPPAELESHPRLLRYLRRSSFIGWLWSLGFRCP